MKKRGGFLLVLAVISAGCVFTPQAVNLKPQVRIEPTSGGQGRFILVTVVDERPRSILGTRGVGGSGANLTIAQDLPTVVRAAARESLQRQGFTPQTEKPADGRELRVEIRNLDYAVTQGFWTLTLHIECGLKAICILGTDRPYERLYRGEVEETVLGIQSEEENERYVNTALSKAINELFQDSQMSQCLVTGSAATFVGTAGSPVLKRDVTKMIMLMDSEKDKTCTQRTIVKTEVAEVREAPRLGVERWTIDRCGKLVNYRAVLTPGPQGGTEFTVQFEQ